MVEAQALYRPAAYRRRTPWLRRVILVIAGVTVVLPLSAILLFRFMPPPITPLMLATAIADGGYVERWVPLTAISPNLVRAVIASEDAKFCSHHGFDWDSIDQAIAHNEERPTLRGASTISQQTAKNLFLSPARTWTRKGIEAYLTLLIETLWPKRRILEVYLNVVEWGPQIFGAEAAARADFRKPAARLSVLEAARLAAILPNPKTYHAARPGPYVVRQSQVIAARMAQVSRDKLDACIY